MIIDFRVRPPIPSYLNSGAFHVWTDPELGYQCQWEGRIKDPSMDGDMDAFVREMDETGIDIAVIIGRMSKSNDKGSGNITADELDAVCKRYPGRFIGMPALDPQDEDAFAQIDHALELGMPAICMEPFWCQTPMNLNDRRLFPIYEYLQEKRMLFNTTLNFNCGYHSSTNDPFHLEEVAKAFPDLPILVTHACWPRGVELMAIAVRYPNIYLVPESYVYFPFVNTVKDQMIMYNHMLQDQVLFGSSYPIRGFKQSLEHSLALDWLPGPREKFLWKSAARLLKLKLTPADV